PLIRIGADRGYVVAELLVLLALLQRLLQGVARLIGAGEPGTSQLPRSHLRVLGVFQDVDLEPPPLPHVGVVSLDRARLPRAGAPLLLLTPAAPPCGLWLLRHDRVLLAVVCPGRWVSP